MNIDFPAVKFQTYELGPEQVVKDRIISRIKLIAFLIIGVILTLVLGNLSFYLGLFIPFLGFISIKFFIAAKGRKELNNFKRNGILTIDNQGLLIEQEEKRVLAYEKIRSINIQFDRADPLYIGKFPQAMTYKVIIHIDQNIETLSVANQAELGYRKIYRNLIETVEVLRQSNHTLYKKIRINE